MGREIPVLFYATILNIDRFRHFQKLAIFLMLKIQYRVLKEGLSQVISVFVFTKQ